MLHWWVLVAGVRGAGPGLRAPGVWGCGAAKDRAGVGGAGAVEPPSEALFADALPAPLEGVTAFQRLLIMKVFRPEKIVECLGEYIACLAGFKGVEGSRYSGER